MINKSLEVLLKDAGYLSCIPLIEVCETDKNVKEIEVDKINGFTKSDVINKQIESYLDELNIRVKYIDMKDRLKDLDEHSNSVVKDKPKCKNVVHVPFKRPMSKNKKVEMYNNYKMKMFVIDGDTFVNCPDCFNFEKL